MADSADDRENDRGEKKIKSRRPGNTAFRQQRLKAWQPILTPKTVLPLFFAIGMIFAPIGGLLLYASGKVQEIMIDYTHCTSGSESSQELVDIPSKYVYKSFHKAKSDLLENKQPQWKYTSDNGRKNCTLVFTIPTDLDPPVLFYYRLTNFYQNHRRYVKSVDEDQLKGTAVSVSHLESANDCDPLVKNDEGKAYYPCGLMANSLFNDTFSPPLQINTVGNSQNSSEYKMTDRGIAWGSDQARYGKTKYNVSDIVPPPNWIEKFPNGYTEQNLPDLKTWEAFQVWMRTAGLPTFSKLALRNDVDKMLAGTYQVEIADHFPVRSYSGTKSIVISTRTVVGGKNPFMGIAYVVVGGLCVVLGAIFTARHLVKPRKLGDHTYLSWNNEPSNAAPLGRDVRGGSSAIER